MTKLAMPFDNPATYPGHSGVDFAGHAGEPFPASAPGVVTWLGRNTRGGYFIWVRYDDGPAVGYHHMNSHAGCPRVGERFVAGQRLGYVGWSGHVVPAGRAGAHLHSEVEGHATTDGYWKFFDRTRVVGSGSAAGGIDGGDEEFMSKIDDLWQRWQPGKAGVKTAGDLYLLFAETVTKIRNVGATAAEAVWSTKIKRNNGTVSALQELADSKTYGIRANEKLDELLKRPVASVSLTDAQIATLAKSVGEQVALSIAPKILDQMAERLKS